MIALTPDAVGQALAARVERTLKDQIADPSHSDCGALIAPDWGMSAL